MWEARGNLDMFQHKVTSLLLNKVTFLFKSYVDVYI